MQVGDYVRTKSGFIDKIININDCREPSMKYALEQPSWNDDIIFIGDEDISKSSPNIIDLIQEGDLVNNHIVGQIFYENQTLDNIKYLDLEGVNILVCNDDIKSITTKEQFESMEYKVGE